MVTSLEKNLLVVMMFLLMMGMGATLNWDNFKIAFKKPKGILIGFLSAFGFMPIISFGMAYLFSFPNELAVGLILLGCTPGGTTSNMFAYFSKGDVALSISMTVSTTITAFFMMPFLLYFYAAPFTTTTVSIPYVNIIGSLVIIVLPVIIGMTIKGKSESAAGKVEKLGSISGILALLVLFFGYILRNWQLMMETSWMVYVGAALLGIIGFFFGYFLSIIFGLDSVKRRTVSLETGIKNAPLTATIILISFPEELANQIIQLPIFYGLLIVVTSSLATMIFRMFFIDKETENA